MSRKDPLDALYKERVTNHEKFFIENKKKFPREISFNPKIRVASFACIGLGMLIALFAFSQETSQMMIFLKFVAIILILIPLVIACSDETNLKGVPLDPRTDLVCNVAYNVDDIFGKEHCMISVANPGTNAFSCIAESWPIKQMAERQGYEFGEDLVFELKKNRRICVIHGRKKIS